MRVYVHDFVFILSPMDGCLDCLLLLAIVNNATMNMNVQISVQFLNFNSLEIDIPLKILVSEF